MEQESLRAERRVLAGSRPSKRLRREGRVPAVVYGRGLEPIPVAVSGRELYAILHQEAGVNAVISLQVDEAVDVLAVAREIQRDPVRGTITHLDFIKVSLDEPINAEVVIDFTGIPVGVKDGGGFVETLQATVTVSALPMQIPGSIPADISHLELFDTYRVADLPTIEGVTYLTEGEHPLATVVLPAVEEVPEAAEEIEGEEGAAEEAGEAAQPEEPAEG